MKSKKGAELALNIVIIAVIALLVMVVLLFIFGGKINIFSKGVSNCESLGGECKEELCLRLDPPRPAVPSGDCEAPEGETRYCCSKALG